MATLSGGWFDYASTFAAATAGANTEIMSTHVDPVGSPLYSTKWPRRECECESGHCCFGTGPPITHANARRRLISPAAVTHAIGSAPARTGRVYSSTKETKHEHGTSGGVAVGHNGEATVVAAAPIGSGSVSIGGIPPTGGEGHNQCTTYKTTTTPLWRRDPQGQLLCNACGVFNLGRNSTASLGLVPSRRT